MKNLLIFLALAAVLCGCDTIRNEMARDPETGLIWHDPRVGTTKGSTYIPPAGDVTITLPEHSSNSSTLTTYAMDGGFGLRFFDLANGTWQLESRTMPYLKFDRCFTDDEHMRKIVSGTATLFRNRYQATLCKYIIDTKDRAIYFLFFIPEGSSATADGKRVDIYLSTSMFEQNGKMYWITYQPALSDRHDPIEIPELDALRKCREGIKTAESE